MGSLLHLVKRWRRLPAGNKWLVAEALLLLPLAKLGIHFFPFKRIVQLLGKPHTESAKELNPAVYQQILQIRKTTSFVANKLPWKSKCFDQAIAVKIMLSRRGIPATVYFGVAINSENEMEAHAWVRSGEIFVSGWTGKDRYSIVATFS